MRVRVLVSGATGFVGRAVTEGLSSAGHEVFALSRRSFPSMPDIHVIIRDLTGPLNLDPREVPVEVVIQLAQANGADATNPAVLFGINLQSTVDLLVFGLRAGIGKFIFTSSGDVYQPKAGKYTETDPVGPSSLYGKSKLAAERVCEAFADHFKVVVLRLFHPYGPGQVNRLIPRMAAKIRRGEAITCSKGGHPFVTPTYINDVVLSYLRALDLQEQSAIMNVAGSDCVSIPELAEKIGEILDLPLRLLETQHAASDIAGDNLLMRELLALPPLVGLGEGLKRTLI